MNRALLKNGDLPPESFSAMKKVTTGASDLALKASMDLCITILWKNGFSLQEIEKFINIQAARAVRNYNTV